MSSRGWKLSAALIFSVFSSVCIADDIDPNYYRAMTCSFIAATVYSELTSEPADAIAKAAPQRCYREWKAADVSTQARALAKTEKAMGRQITPEEKAQLPYLSAMSEEVTNEL